MDSLAKARILVVDDDASITGLLRLLLLKEGFEVNTASSGENGFAEALRHRPDMAILDVMMPGMDGYALCRKLRENASTRSIPILMLTSLGQATDKIAGFEAGANDYVLKPFEPAEIPYRVKNLLARAAEPSPLQVEQRRVGRTIVIYSTKGGAGKTTLAANLAVALKRRGAKRVALLDASFAVGDVGVCFNVPPLHSFPDLVKDAGEIEPEMVEQVCQSHQSGVRLLLSPLGPERADLIQPSHVERVLAILANLYDDVIVDCQSSYEERMLIVLQHADILCLMVTPEIGTIIKTMRFLELAGKLGVSEDKIWVILNRANSKVGLEPGEIARTLRCQFSLQIASHGRSVSLSINRGEPLVMAQPEHPFSQQMLQMADRLLKPAP